jgi:hypothetical protein
LLTILSQNKATAVANEDFELAGALYNMIKTLLASSESLTAAEQSKLVAVSTEDYATASLLKKQLDVMRTDLIKVVDDVKLQCKELGVDVDKDVRDRDRDRDRDRGRDREETGEQRTPQQQQQQQQQQHDSEFIQQQSPPPYNNHNHYHNSHMKSPPLNNAVYLANKTTPDNGNYYDDHADANDANDANDAYNDEQQQQTQQQQQQQQQQPSPTPYEENYAETKHKNVIEQHVDPMEAPLAASRGNAGMNNMNNIQSPLQQQFNEEYDETSIPANSNSNNMNDIDVIKPMNKTGRMGKAINYNESMDNGVPNDAAPSDAPNDYDDFDIDPNEMSNNATATDEKDAESSSFKPGEHPLDGVPGINAQEMPTPDPLPSTGGEGYPMDILGAYIIRCLHSKNWSLREAALAKCCVLISNNDVNVCDNITSFCNLIKLGLNDTISHVLLTALNVLQDCVNAWSEGNINRSQLSASVDSCLSTVLNKFGDASSKVRGEASSALSFIADASCIGPSHIASLLSKPMPKKQQNAPKPISARLALMTELVERYGLKENSGLSASSLMGFVKSVNGFAHTSAEVRTKTKLLTIAIHKNIGKDVEKYLTTLRPKQLEEYRESFLDVAEEEEEEEDRENEQPVVGSSRPTTDGGHDSRDRGGIKSPGSSKPASREGSRGRGRGRRQSSGNSKEVGGDSNGSGEGGGAAPAAAEDDAQFEDDEIAETFTY